MSTGRCPYCTAALGPATERSWCPICGAWADNRGWHPAHMRRQGPMRWVLTRLLFALVVLVALVAVFSALSARLAER